MPKNQYFELLINNNNVFFHYLKEKYPVYKNSNIFFRDIQFGIQSFFEKRDIKLNYATAEELAKQLTKFYEEKGILQKLYSNTWKVNSYEELLVKD